jgi:PAS domain S-box-containing protein
MSAPENEGTYLSSKSDEHALPFLRGGGEMGALIRSHDWSSTPLDSPERWPTELKTAVGLMLGATQPVYIAYGPELTSLYNDGYLPIVGTKHPTGFGAPFAKLWEEIWQDFEPIVEATLAGDAQHFVNLPIALAGRPHLPVGYFTFSYTALRDDAGNATGFYCAATETTEQVLNQQKLRLSEERLELALSAGNGVGTYDWDVQADRVVADARFAKLYGVDPARAAAGAPIAEFFQHIHPDDFPETQAKIDEAMRSGELFSAEYRLVQPDGSAPWVLAEGRCLLGPTGEPLRFSGVTFDVTARRNAADELRRLNTELERQVIERTQARGTTWQVSPDLLGALNSEGYFETSNPAWQTVLGWSEAEVASTSIWDLLHPDDLERTRGGFALTQVGQAAIKFPNRYRCKEGGYRWISWIGVPEDGLVYCSGRDITDDVAAATERERVFALSPDLIGVATFDGKLKSINPAWSAALGRSEAELLARPFAEIIHPDDLELTGEVVGTLQAGQPVHQFFVRLLKSDGTTIPYAWTAVPDEDPDSGIFYTVGRDMTEDLAKAEELRAAQEALRQSQKMEAVGQLTGGIAHDFNNLLTGISGSLELIQKRMRDQGISGFERHLGIARAATDRAAALTQRLLAFSRRQTLDPKPVDVNRLVGGVEDLLRRSVDPSIEIAVVGAIGLWLTRIDGAQLENAILNLVINARDAMPDGGRITIETANKWIDGHAAKERDLAPGQYVSLCVTDTGTGMPAEVIDRVFDPFFTTKPLGQGTGLGLSMIHGFVRQSGGQVRVYSELGQGTTMCLYLPRYAGELEEETRDEAEAPIEQSLGETILVIDDEEPIRMLIADVLGEAGYRILEAGDGVAGLKILQSDLRIDLLITDVGLPGGFNGRQVADSARQTRPDLKVLFVTGYAENAVVGNGHLDPGMEVITKPFPMTTLALRVREIIES